MQQKISEKDFSGQSIYIGLDVHRKAWKVSVMTETLMYKTFSSPPVAEKLGNYLRNHFPGATYYSAYEAGFSGFWLHRELTKLGVNSMVVNPGDIPTTDKERKQKEDLRDSRKIAQSLRAGQLKGIFIPSEKVQQDRILLRTRETIVKDLKRSKHRIKSLLYFQGIQYPDRFYLNSTHWSKAFIKWLDGLTFVHESGKGGLNAHLEMVRQLRGLLLKVTRQIRELSRGPDYSQAAELLMGIPGIGMLTAMKILTELETIERFENFDSLCSYVGLVPSTNSSGENLVDSGITPRRNSRLRAALVESAWIAVRNDSALLASYQKLCRRMPGNRAIIRIAKKLLNRIVYVLRSKEKYEKSVVK